LKDKNLDHLLSEAHNAIRQLNDFGYKDIQSVKDSINVSKKISE